MSKYLSQVWLKTCPTNLTDFLGVITGLAQFTVVQCSFNYSPIDHDRSSLLQYYLRSCPAAATENRLLFETSNHKEQTPSQPVMHAEDWVGFFTRKSRNDRCDRLPAYIFCGLSESSIVMVHQNEENEHIRQNQEYCHQAAKRHSKIL